MTAKQILTRLKKLNPDTRIRLFDCFGQMFTTDFSCDSWRGSYDLPATVVHPIDVINECCIASDCIENISAVDGMNVTGHKGGDYMLDEDDEIFLVSSFNTSGNSTTITEIYDDGYCVIESNSY